ncbi:MAG: selenide, water dikinase SelD [Nitrospirae bacterium]|nr:selenide, water dikinase SelD [Nitrospirota bacterium]
MKKIKLTSLSHGSGCGCKMTRKDLAVVLANIPEAQDPNVIIGTATADDAAVYKIDDKRAIVQTIDFFTPIVDDPYCYGQISAANSISDIYAMGGRPLFALSIIAFPIKTISASILEEIVKGGIDKAKEAGIEIIGGHSIDDPEPKYGLTVTGVVELDKVVRNDKAQAGDILILTKPLGTGIISRAIKSDDAADEDIKEAIDVMSFLNKGASEAMVEAGIKAATDITGFGLLGHLYGMLKASGVGAKLSLSSIPTINGVWNYAKKGHIPGGTKNNLDYVEGKVVWGDSVSKEAKYVIADAQTSGGLLISCPKEKKEKLIALLSKAGCLAVSEIGEIVEDKESRLWIS